MSKNTFFPLSLKISQCHHAHSGFLLRQSSRSDLSSCEGSSILLIAKQNILSEWHQTVPPHGAPKARCFAESETLPSRITSAFRFSGVSCSTKTQHLQSLVQGTGHHHCTTNRLRSATAATMAALSEVHLRLPSLDRHQSCSICLQTLKSKQRSTRSTKSNTKTSSDSNTSAIHSNAES